LLDRHRGSFGAHRCRRIALFADRPGAETGPPPAACPVRLDLPQVHLPWATWRCSYLFAGTPSWVLPSPVIVRLIAADKMPRNLFENRNRRLMLCSRNATKSSAEAILSSGPCSLVQHEFADPLDRPRNGRAPGWIGATDRSSGFLAANECNEACIAIKVLTSRRRSSRSRSVINAVNAT
jgi:hypothetical protein